MDCIVTSYRIINRSLLIEFGGLRRVLSSAPRGGGVRHARSIINHQVMTNPMPMRSNEHAPKWGDPTRYLGQIATRIRALQPCVGLMTAVPLKRLVIVREETDDLWVEGFFTVGVTNAVRAGEPVAPFSKPGNQPAGTINIILVTNAALTLSAMVTAVQVVSEAKTAALLDNQILSSTSDALATGTGTDAVVIVSGHGRRHRYSGTHTKLGELIGKVGLAGVHKGLLAAIDHSN